MTVNQRVTFTVEDWERIKELSGLPEFRDGTRGYPVKVPATEILVAAMNRLLKMRPVELSAQSPFAFVQRGGDRSEV